MRRGGEETEMAGLRERRFDEEIKMRNAMIDAERYLGEINLLLRREREGCAINVLHRQWLAARDRRDEALARWKAARRLLPAPRSASIRLDTPPMQQAPIVKRLTASLSVKSLDDAKRIVEGTATASSPDRLRDVVEPAGAVFKLPMALLWQHRHDMPVGRVVEAKPTRTGINIVAQLAKITEEGE